MNVHNPPMSARCYEHRMHVVLRVQPSNIPLHALGNEHRFHWFVFSPCNADGSCAIPSRFVFLDSLEDDSVDFQNVLLGKWFNSLGQIFYEPERAPQVDDLE